MGKIKENAYIEKCTVLHENQPKPYIYFNVFADGEQLCEVSFERLIVIRDMINRIESEEKGGKQ